MFLCVLCECTLCVRVCGSCKQTKLRTFGKQLTKQSLQFKRQFIFDFRKVNAPPLFKVLQSALAELNSACCMHVYGGWVLSLCVCVCVCSCGKRS